MARHPITSSAVYLLPGMTITISFDYQHGRPAKGEQEITNFAGEKETRTLIRGFAVVDETTGTIEETDKVETAIYYKHKRFSQNRIYLFGERGETSYVDVLSVPIHDHSSIAAGGPAYGTYFTDSDTI